MYLKEIISIIHLDMLKQMDIKESLKNHNFFKDNFGHL